MKSKHDATRTAASAPVVKARAHDKANSQSKAKRKAKAAPATTPNTGGAGATTFQPQTELGKKLWAIRQRIVASGAPLLDEDGIRQEVAARRGGVEWHE